MKVFIDTGAWLALEIKNDINHSVAKKFAQELIKKRALLFTNNYVLSETYTRLTYDVNLKTAIKFQKTIKKAISENLQVLELLTVEFDGVFEELKRYRDKKFSFTDGSIIFHYKKYRLDNIFTFDHSFKEANLPTNLY